MADLNITTDFSEVNNLNNALTKTGDLFTKTVDSLVREEARASRVTKKLAATTQANLDLITRADAIVAAKVQQESLKREKTRAREADRAEKEANRIVAANEKVIAAEIKLRAEIERNAAKTAQGYQNQIGGNLGLGAKGVSAGASSGAFEAEIERLRLKYDQVYASSQLYERSLTELNSAHTLGAMSTKKHEVAVEALNLEYQNFQSGVGQAGNRFAQHVNQVSTGANRMGVAAQQSGYQISDFIVQVQGGTNPLVAFSQQATQMAGLLYLLPPAFQATTYSVFGLKVAMSTLFMGVTIAIPLLAMLAMSFFGSGKEAKDAGKEVNELEERIKALDNALKDYLQTKKAESMGITPDELTSVDAMTKATNDLAAANAILDKTRLTTASGPAAAIALRNQARLDAVDVAAAEVARADALERINLLKQRSLDLSSQESSQMQATHELEYTRLRFGEQSVRYKELEAKAARDSVAAELRGLDIGESRVTVLMQQYDAQLAVVKALEAQNVSAKAFVSSLVKAASVDLASVFSSASPFAQTLLNKVNGIVGAMQNAIAVASAENQLSQMIMEFSPGGQALGKYGARGTTVENPTLIGATGGAGSGGGSGGGGGGGAGNAGLESLLTSLQTEREVIDEWYAESQTILQSASDTELQIIGGSNEAKLRLEQEYQEKLKGIRDAGGNTALGDAATFFGGMADIARVGGDKTVKAMRIFSAAQALINSYVAFTEVLKDPSFIGRPWARFGAAASALSSGLAAVSAIKGGSGGGGVSRGSAAVAAPSSAAPAPQTVFIDSLDPDGLYSGQALINLFDAFYDENDRRGKVFVVGR